MKTPKLLRIQQAFERPKVDDISLTVQQQLEGLKLSDTIQAGQTVAITVGSRGIANIHTITKAIVDHCLKLEAKPFIVPAMGSHGGGTAEGQQEIVESYGVTEDFVGCPIRSSMETVRICETNEGIPVYFDKQAYDADHVIVAGRIKPHTGFVGDIESGLMKMMLIGLGKHDGAKIYHRAIVNYSFGQIVRSVASEVLSRCGIVAGLAIVENSYDETAMLEAVAPSQFESREKELLVLAKKWMPRLPFESADVLLIDEFGKNISGSGMDTNVVGRKFGVHAPGEDETPRIKHIFVRGLTEETHGNAAGIGFAEFCSKRVVDEMNWEYTKINCLTGGGPAGAMIPIYYDTERESMEAVFSNIGLTPAEDCRLLWIKNTLEVSQMVCSTAYQDEIENDDTLSIIGETFDIQWTDAGDLVSPIAES